MLVLVLVAVLPGHDLGGGTMTIKQPAYDPLLRAVGLAVQKQRIAVGISQEELARRANLHRTYVSDVERGSRSVSLITLCKIAEALGTHAFLLVQEPELTFGKISQN